MDDGVLVPIAFFAMIAAIVILPKYLQSRDRDKLHETLRLAYEKGQPVPPELLEALQPQRTRPASSTSDGVHRDVRLGVIWLAIGVGLLLIGCAFYAMLYTLGGAIETGCSFAALAAVPISIGLAFLLLAALGRRKRA